MAESNAQKDKAATAEWVSLIGQLQRYLIFSLNPEVFFAFLKIVLFCVLYKCSYRQNNTATYLRFKIIIGSYFEI